MFVSIGSTTHRQAADVLLYQARKTGLITNQETTVSDCMNIYQDHVDVAVFLHIGPAPTLKPIARAVVSFPLSKCRTSDGRKYKQILDIGVLKDYQQLKP